jgi:hypothetical protein
MQCNESSEYIGVFDAFHDVGALLAGARDVCSMHYDANIVHVAGIHKRVPVHVVFVAALRWLSSSR